MDARHPFRAAVCIVALLAASAAGATVHYLNAPFDGAADFTGSGPAATGGPWDPAGVVVGTGVVANHEPALISAYVDPAAGLDGTAKGFHFADTTARSLLLSLFADGAVSGPSLTDPYWVQFRMRADPASVPAGDAHLHFTVTDAAGADVVHVSFGKSGADELRYKIYLDGGNLVGNLDAWDAADEWRVLIRCDPAAGEQLHSVWKNGDTMIAPLLDTVHPLLDPQGAALDRLLFQTGWGDTADVVVDNVEVTDAGPPAIPEELAAWPAGAGLVELAWTDESNDELGFRVERSTDGETGWTEIATPGAGAVSHVDGGLNDRTDYWYRVAAYNQNGNSAWAGPARARTVYVGKPFSDWISVEESGADGSDTVDDTEAIQDALDELNGDWGAATAQVLYFPDGEYLISDADGDGVGLLLERTVNDDGVTPRQHNGLQIVGESPGGVVLRWVGTTPGTAADPNVLFHDNGNPRCIFRNIVWDGGDAPGTSSNFVVAFDQSSKAVDGWHDSATGHYDSVFRNAHIGLRLGNFHKQNSEVTVRRGSFLDNDAGVSVEDFNALNIWLWDSEFVDNDYGVSNAFAEGGSGNYRVIGGRFTNSAMSDLAISNTGNFTVRDSWSTGSNRFLETSLSSAGSRYSIINNEIADYTAADGRAILAKNAGPFLLIDNRISSPPAAIPPIWVQAPGGPTFPEDYRTHLIAMHNEYTVAAPYATSHADCCKLLTIDDRQVAPFAVTPPPLPTPTDELDMRPIYTVTDGDNLHEVLAAALADPLPAVVHLPNGTYDIDETVQIPAGADLWLTGNGKTTRLRWRGDPDGTMIAVDGHTVAGLTVRDLFLDGEDLATAIRVDDLNQEQSRALFNKVVVAHPSAAEGEAGFVIDRTDRVEVVSFDSGTDGAIQQSGGCDPDPVSVGWRIVGGPQPQAGTFVWTGATAGNEWDFDIVNGPSGVRALISSYYMEDSAHATRVRGAGGPGEVTHHGGKIAISCRAATNAISVENFTGNVGVVGNSIFDLDPDGARIEHSGTEPVAIEALGNAVVQDPEFLMGPGATFHRAVEVMFCQQGATPLQIPPCFAPSHPSAVGTMPIDDIDPDPAALDAAVRLLRDYRPPGFYDEPGASATYQINFDNVRIAEPISGIVLAGGIPLAPTTLSATAWDAGRVDLSWTDGSSDEDEFRIERSETSGSGFVQIAVAPADTTEFSDTTVTAGTLYYYRVAAYRTRTGSSAWSNEADARPASPGGTPDGGDALPPLILNKSPDDVTDIVMTWSASCSAAATEYAVYAGSFGSWHDTQPIVCSTPATQATVSPDPGSRFYLVVPLADDVEGSYGVDGSGDPRPRSTTPCVEHQATAGCD